MRLDAVARSERLAATGMRQAEADARAAEAAGVSAATLRRWRLACRDLPPEARLAALTDRPGRGRRGTMTDPAMRDCVEALIHGHGPHLTAPHVCRVLKERHGHAPSPRTVQRWLGNWRADAANARALSAVSDPDGHRSRRAPAMGSMTRAVIRLNQVWELDSTPADVMCADGRHAIVGAMDVWSRALSWTGETRRIADERALDPLLAAPVAHGGRRTIGKKGISVGNVLYIEPTFGAHVGERVDVRLDASDPSRLMAAMKKVYPMDDHPENEPGKGE